MRSIKTDGSLSYGDGSGDQEDSGFKEYGDSKKSTACANELDMGVKGEVAVRVMFVFPTGQLEGISHQDWEHWRRACLGRDGQVRLWRL